MWTGALSALPSSVPAHPEGVRFTPEQADEVIAAIGEVLADTELTVDELTARQRRELDDETALVGAVMEATPTLTVGQVTVGPHA